MYSPSATRRGSGEVSNRKRCSALIFIGIFIWLAFAITATHPKRTNIGNLRVDSMILLHCMNTFTHTQHTSIPTYLHIFMDFSRNAAILSHFIATVNCFSSSRIPTHTSSLHTRSLIRLFIENTHTYMHWAHICRWKVYWHFSLLAVLFAIHTVARWPCLVVGMWELCKSSAVSIIFYSFRTRTHFQSKNLIIYKFADVITFFSFRLAARREM